MKPRSSLPPREQKSHDFHEISCAETEFSNHIEFCNTFSRHRSAGPDSRCSNSALPRQRRGTTPRAEDPTQQRILMRPLPGAQPEFRSSAHTPTGFRGSNRSQSGLEYTVYFAAPLSGATVVPAGTPLEFARVSTPSPPPAASKPAPPAPVSVATPKSSVSAPRSEIIAPTGSFERNNLEILLENIRAEVARLRREESDRLQAWQRAAVELAMTIATRLLHERVVSGEFPLEAKVRDMVSQLGENGPLTIRLHPADLETLSRRLGGRPLLPNKSDPQVLPDASLARAECQVEGKESMLLSDVTRELQEIRDELLRSLAHART